jgi:activator of HSP90 ATPase
MEVMKMLETIELSIILPVSPEKLYRAWLDSAEHTAFTGGAANIEPQVGGAFSAWDGYIRGVTLVLEPYQRIVQTWRSSDFPEASANSRLEVLLDEVEAGTKLTLIHSEIPDGQGEEYRQGWVESYFNPMEEYFSGQ